jgi:hypothetical protein
MRYYHAIFKNPQPVNQQLTVTYQSTGGAFEGNFTEEPARANGNIDATFVIVLVHFFDTEEQLHQFAMPGNVAGFLH